MSMATDSRGSFHPWRTPLLVLAGLSLGGLLFIEAYGPLDSTELVLAGFALVALAVWGGIRSLQHGPAFEHLLPSDRGPSPPEPLAVRLRWAYRHAVPLAGLFSVYVAVVAVLGGGRLVSRSFGNPWAVVGAYWLAAAIGGFALAVLKPLARYRLGAFLIGCVVGSAVYGTAMLALPTVVDAPWWTFLPPAIVVGGGLGLVEFDSE
jgi:hypothetical protein